MQDQQSILQCPYCGHYFDEEKRKPMILCMSQHTSCFWCVQKMFKNKSKEELIQCPFRCGKINFGSIQPFRYMKQIIETKVSLRKIGSCLKKQKILYDIDKQKMIELLQKQKEKNEWLIQLNSKRQDNIISQSNKIMKQLLETELKKMQKKIIENLLIMQKRSRNMFQSEFQDYKQKSVRSLQKEGVSEANMVKLQKKMNQQMTIINTLNKSLQPLQKIQKNIKKINQFQDTYLKVIKSLETESANIKQQLTNIAESIKFVKAEKKDINQTQNKRVEYKMDDRRLSLQVTDNRQKNKAFVKKAIIPYKQYKYEKIEQKTHQPKKEKKVQKPIQNTKTKYDSVKFKTESDQTQKQFIFGKQQAEMNSMRNTIGPLKMPQYHFIDREQDFNNKTQRPSNYFTGVNKNNNKSRSFTNLNQNVSLIEEQTAQQKKVDSILKKIEDIHGKQKVSAKTLLLKVKIDNHIHLPEHQIIQKLNKQISF